MVVKKDGRRERFERQKLVAGLRMLATKREELPRRKHGNVPL